MRRSTFLAFFLVIAGCLLAAAQQQNSPTTLRGEQQLTFDSFSMWVDDKEAKLLIVYEGQLLRLPFTLSLGT